MSLTEKPARARRALATATLRQIGKNSARAKMARAGRPKMRGRTTGVAVNGQNRQVRSSFLAAAGWVAPGAMSVHEVMYREVLRRKGVAARRL
jgi:hypothetical protein